MKILVTGATGYVGRAVAARFRSCGYELLALARSSEAADVLASRGYRVVRGDLRDAAHLAALALDCDAVVHTAFPFGKTDTGVIFEPGARAARLVYAALQIEAAASRAILDAYRGTGKTLLLVTGTGAFGDTGAHRPGEECEVPSSTLFALRGRTERAAIQAGAHGVRTIVIRAASVYGHGGSMLVPFLIASARRLGAAFCIAGSENNGWSFVHVDDLARLCAHALRQAGPGQVFHGATAEPVRCIEVAAAVHEAIGAAGPLASLSVDEAVARFGGLARFWRINNQVTPTRSYQLGWRPAEPSVLEDIKYGSYRLSTVVPA